MTKKKWVLFSIDQRLLIKIILGFVFVYLFFILFKSLRNSLFFSKNDRTNIVFYGKKTTFISLGLDDSVNYVTYPDNNLSVILPGGYGRYKVGTIGRLAELDKKPQIIQKAFSSAFSTYVDFYFYPKKSGVYHYSEKEARSVVPELNMSDMITSKYLTNAGFFDVIRITSILSNKRKGDFLEIDSSLKESFEANFFKKYQGYFYQKLLREERQSVEIIYQNYSSASILARIIEGEGIRVSDMTPDNTRGKECKIKKKTDQISKTTDFLSKTFGCKIEVKGEKDEMKDIIMILGERLEREWE